MKVTAIKTRILQPPEDDLLEVISSSVSSLKEKSVFVITSKVVSIWQGRCVPVTSIAKDELIMQEADIYLPRDLVSGAWCMHTVKNDVFIPSAGIDESNAASHYILCLSAGRYAKSHILFFSQGLNLPGKNNLITIIIG